MADYLSCLIYHYVFDLCDSTECAIKLKAVIPGTIFATVGWMLLSQVFGIYAKYFATRVSGYQIIGSFIVLMLWLNFAATIIIFGGIINAVVQEYITGNEIKKRRVSTNKWWIRFKNKFSQKKIELRVFIA